MLKFPEDRAKLHLLCSSDAPRERLGLWQVRCYLMTVKSLCLRRCSMTREKRDWRELCAAVANELIAMLDER
jgi:hypothetical protein